MGSFDGVSAYDAVKGAIWILTKNAAVMYANFNVRGNSVHPGFISTAITDAQTEDFNKIVIDATSMKRLENPKISQLTWSFWPAVVPDMSRGACNR